MAVTINTEPDSISNTSVWDVTTSLTESASIVNLRLKVEIMNQAGSVTYATLYYPKGLDDIDLTNVMYSLFSYDIQEFEDNLLSTPLSNSFFDYEVKFTEIYENASGVLQTGANNTSSHLKIVRLEISNYEGLSFSDFLIQDPDDQATSLFLSNYFNTREIYKGNNKLNYAFSYSASSFVFFSDPLTIVHCTVGASSAYHGCLLTPASTVLLNIESRKKYYISFNFDLISGTAPYLMLMVSGFVVVSQLYTIQAGYNCIEVVSKQAHSSAYICVGSKVTSNFRIWNIQMTEYPPAFHNIYFLTDESNVFPYIQPIDTDGNALDEFYLEGGSQLISALTDSGWDSFDDFTNAVRSATNAAGASYIVSADQGAVTASTLFTVEIYIEHAGAATIQAYIVEAAVDTTSISGTKIAIVNGFNKFSVQCDGAYATSFLKLYFNGSTTALEAIIMMWKPASAITDNLGIIPITPHLYRDEYSSIDFQMMLDKSNTYTKNSTEISIDIKHKEVRDSINIEWLNSKNGFDAFTFIASHEHNIDAQKSIYQNSEREKKIADVENEGRIKCYTEYLNEKDYEYLAEIMSSKQVYWQRGFTRISVYPVTDSLKIKERRNLIQISIEFSYKK